MDGATWKALGLMGLAALVSGGLASWEARRRAEWERELLVVPRIRVLDERGDGLLHGGDQLAGQGDEGEAVGDGGAEEGAEESCKEGDHGLKPLH